MLDLKAAVLLLFTAEQYPPEDWDGADTLWPIAHCQYVSPLPAVLKRTRVLFLVPLTS